MGKHKDVAFKGKLSSKSVKKAIILDIIASI